MSKGKQFYKLQLVETRIRESGKAAVAVNISDAGAYVVFDDPEQLRQMAKHFENWASALTQKQRKGSATIWVPPGFSSRMSSISPN